MGYVDENEQFISFVGDREVRYLTEYGVMLCPDCVNNQAFYDEVVDAVCYGVDEQVPICDACRLF